MAKVLLLNATYEPLRVISTKKAIVMIVEDKAITEVKGEGEFRSPSTTIPVPAVIRLRQYVKVPYVANKPLTNRAVLARDNYECAYCDKRRADTVDHVIPRSRGGQHAWDNVVAACRKCNAKKADKTLAELDWKIKWQPYTPRGMYWLIIGIKEVDSAWEPYLALGAT